MKKLYLCTNAKCGAMGEWSPCTKCESDALLPSVKWLLANARDKLEGGTLADRYKINKAIGAGAMGAVFRVEDHWLRREIALKLQVKPHDMTDGEAKGRFKREAQILCALDHPNSIRLLDFGECHDIRYLAMELLQGESLSTLLELHRHQLHDPWEAALICADVASALTEAHDKKLVHRDVKPDNIFLQKVPPSTRVVKLLDFGIAKHQEPGGHPGLYETETPAARGTVSYMAPEQALHALPEAELSRVDPEYKLRLPASLMNRGGVFKPPQVGAEADIFALGVTLFELIAGRLPYTIEPGKYRFVDLIKVHYETRPTLPAEVPAALRELVDAMLSLDPTQRPTALQVVSRVREAERGREEEKIRALEQERAVAQLSIQVAAAEALLQQEQSKFAKLERRVQVHQAEVARVRQERGALQDAQAEIVVLAERIRGLATVSASRTLSPTPLPSPSLPEPVESGPLPPPGAFPKRPVEAVVAPRHRRPLGSGKIFWVVCLCFVMSALLGYSLIWYTSPARRGVAGSGVGVVPDALVQPSTSAAASISPPWSREDVKWKDLRIPPIHRIAAGEHKVPVVKGSTETRSVTLASPLGLAEPETTRALWQAQGGPETAGEKDPDGQACMEVLGGLLAQDDRPITCVSVSEVLLWLNRLSRAAGYDEVYSLDAAQVTWHRDRAGFRLPTRDEWEVGAWARTGRCISTSPAGFTTRGGKGEFQSNILLAPVGTWKDDRACWLLQDPHGNASELVWTLPDPGGDATVRAFNGESSKSWLRLGKGVTREVDDDLALTLATSHSKPQTLLSADSRALDAGFRIAWGAVENK